MAIGDGECGDGGDVSSDDEQGDDDDECVSGDDSVAQDPNKSSNFSIFTYILFLKIWTTI